MKTFIYYGTEENFFEPEKHESNNIVEDLGNHLDESFSDEETDTIINDILVDMENNGYGYYEDVNGQGYDFFIGAAKQGNCNHLRKLLSEKRKECMELSGF